MLTLFCLVSGGPHGLEEGVNTAGAGLGLLLILILPIVWAYPVALMTAELTAAIPAEGGYYEWAKRAFGGFWGFQTGWWTWLYSMADAAIYPVLFASYLTSLEKLFFGASYLESHPLLRWGVALLAIIAFSWLNVRGTRLVGRTSVVLGLFLIAPFVAMAIVGLVRYIGDPGPIVREFTPIGVSTGSAFVSGLYIVMWNYLGWDTLSTVSEEVERPERTFPHALLICVPIVTAVYVLPVIVGLRFAPDSSVWTDGSWPLIAREVGGDWLGLWVNLAGLASPIALFVTAVLGASRIPFVLADEGFFPKPLLKVHPKYHTPWASIVFCGLTYAVLAYYFTFQALVELNVTLYAVSLIPELLALLVLRIKEPHLARPYRIPYGWTGVLLVVILPIAVSALAFAASIREDGLADQVPVLVLLASGPVYYGLAKAYRRFRPAAA